MELENNKCCIEIHNASDTAVEFAYRHELAYFGARSKGLVQVNNSKHFPTDQYFHGRVTSATLSLKPLAYDKLIDPSEMPIFLPVLTPLQTILTSLLKMTSIHG